MLVVANEEDALAQLRAGQLCCTRCGGPLAPWGYARPPKLRGVAGAAVELKPRQARCRSCKSAHVVLPGWCLPRRRDTAQVVVGALVAKASGAGHRKIADCLASHDGAGLGSSRHLGCQLRRPGSPAGCVCRRRAPRLGGPKANAPRLCHGGPRPGG